MRRLLIAVCLLSTVAPPAAAQEGGSIERRVFRLEKDVKAIQRRVLGANAEAFEPEITTAAPLPAEPAGVPAGAPVADLTLRIDALERQLATLTGQVEQNGYRLRQLEESAARFRTDTENRLQSIESGRAAAALAPPGRDSAQAAGDTSPAPPRETNEPPPEVAAAPALPPPNTGDPAEDTYTVGFRQWEAKRYDEAVDTLKTVVARWPKHRRASWAQNLAGRALLDSGKPAAAAELFLANYQKMPQGERAPDSLLFLGQALTRLQKYEQACKVYDELNDVYGGTLRPFITERLPQARRDARCKS